MKPTALLLAAGFLSACAGTPKKESVTFDFAAPAQWSTAAAVDPVEGPWWQELADDTAGRLVEEALAHNYNLQTAAQNVEAARAQAKIAGAPQWPQVSASAGGNRNRRNFIGFPIPGGGGGGVQSTTSTTYSADLAVSWEVDLWGRLRAGQAAALADVQAATAEWRGAQQSLAAQTLRAYFAAVEAQRQVELAEATLESYALSNDQVESRYERGLRPSLDLLLSMSSLSTAEANVHQRRRQLDATRRQLEILLGRYPAAAVETRSALPEIALGVPAGLPADLIARRPDLVAAERRLAASGARVKEARRALYPRISLTASGGRSSSDLGDLLDGDFSVWNLVGNLSQPLLQGGRLKAGVKLAEANAERAVLSYAQSALRAYAEVETALAAEGHLAAQEEAMAAAARQSQAARSLAEERYAKGLSDLLTMLTAQRNASDAESRLLAVRRQRLDTRIDLHLALGGGFEAELVATDTSGEQP